MNKIHAKTRLSHLCSLAALGLALGGAAHAQTAMAPPAAGSTGAPVTTDAPMGTAYRSPTTPLTRADAAFIKRAAQNGLAEVESSQVALKKATKPQVKAFAQQMIDDHTRVNNELKALATAKGVEMPTKPALAQQAKLKLLSARDGDEFDAHYAEGMGVEAHEATLKLFKATAQDAKDPDIKAFAAKTVPALEHHLEMARDLNAAMQARENRNAVNDARGADSTTTTTTTPR